MSAQPKNMSELMEMIEQKVNANVSIRFKLPPEKAVEVIKFVEKILNL